MKRSHPPKDRARATSAAKANRSTTLVLFDIDGTLVLTGGAGGRAMASAFEELFAIADAFRGIPMPGRTDAWIVSDAVAAHGIASDSPALAQFPKVYLRHLRHELAQPPPPGKRYGVMPGVRELLDALVDRDDVYLALLTGNYEATARIKLEAFDLWRYFECGAFGDDAPDRNGLLPRAIDRVVACGGPRVEPQSVVVIGDTPLDVACAKAGGARSIAVATGGHGVDELRASGADVVFEDLTDLEAVLNALIADS
ncbi:MAG TPA: HAD family hydrolase [Vicinamibacterales bacterium]|nr:HAD family hydrolase [Vicinamibacterales bacterium]